MITAGLRRAILAAAGRPDAEPLLRPGPAPGSYASSLPFRLAGPGQDPRDAAAALATAMAAAEPWIAAADVTGAGFLTVTVSRDALARLALRVTHAGAACVASDALAGRTVPAPPEMPLAGLDWPRARAALAAQLTARLAATAGATLILTAERSKFPAPVPPSRDVAEAIDFAGADAVRFALARMPPGGAAPQPAVIARHVLANPAYAVRYTHAAAAAVLRWAAGLGLRPAGFRPRLLAGPDGADGVDGVDGTEELALLDALSWLPERVAVAARRGRPDDFAGYLGELAARTLDTMSTTGFTTISGISSERLWLADAARTGLAAGLGLLGIGAPARL